MFFDIKFAGGHRIRVPPVPIPNTEVKPDTADGTAWETVWESRSLPALFRQEPAVVKTIAGFFFVRPQRRARKSLMRCLGRFRVSSLPPLAGDQGLTAARTTLSVSLSRMSMDSKPTLVSKPTHSITDSLSPIWR
jgi:hypothetical protein